ncbi:MAG: hypothetical protein H7Y07_06380 [Pyrinomonadaceae bacterium]|nr:hypothetical protein [Sphingobacteriaceae bacterium]
MISIIICSVKKHELERVSSNISKTIGAEFEIIGIDNTTSKYGICEAYNLGASLAKGDIFCFMHEDIAFETQDWGTLVRNHLNDLKVGIIGVAGGSSKSMVPWSWSPVIFNSEINVVQHHKSGKDTTHVCKTNSPAEPSTIKRVISLDGVWLCVRREVFDQFKFDAHTFPGFHGYDMDFSLQISTKFKVAVVFDILIHHYSEGSFNKEWLESTIKLSNKWKAHLPASVKTLSRENLILQHWACMKLFTTELLNFKFNKLLALKYLCTYSGNSYFKYNHFLSCIKLILFKKSSG